MKISLIGALALSLLATGTLNAAEAPAKVKKKKQIVGEGDYAATRAFDKAQADFVKRNESRIPAMGKGAEAALDGPEGDSLRDAEARAADRSRDTSPRARSLATMGMFCTNFWSRSGIARWPCDRSRQ